MFLIVIQCGWRFHCGGGHRRWRWYTVHHKWYWHFCCRICHRIGWCWRCVGEFWIKISWIVFRRHVSLYNLCLWLNWWCNWDGMLLRKYKLNWNWIKINKTSLEKLIKGKQKWMKAKENIYCVLYQYCVYLCACLCVFVWKYALLEPNITTTTLSLKIMRTHVLIYTTEQYRTEIKRNYGN